MFRFHPTDHHNRPSHHIDIHSEYKPKYANNVHETFKKRKGMESLPQTLIF